MEAQILLRNCGIESLQFNCDHSRFAQSGESLKLDLDLQHEVQGSWSERYARVRLRCCIQVSDSTDSVAISHLKVTYFGDFQFKPSDADEVDTASDRTAIERLLSVN